MRPRAARVADVHTAHTADLDSATFEAAHALLDAALDGTFSEHDWDHALGGLHALAREGSELVGHACIVQRRLLRAASSRGSGCAPTAAAGDTRRRCWTRWSECFVAPTPPPR